jgi:DNA (cytosine-5)-methyltransferase 1
MNYVSLFSGVGGIDLACDRAGMQCVAQVEIDAACRSVLARHWPDAPKFADVREVGKHNLPACDLVVGGFPCQDLSVAGQRAGLSGARSGLFYEMTRIVDELRPLFFLWENVPGLLSSGSGHDFYAVLSELDRIGFDGAWTTLDAQFFGVAQRRRRIFGLFARRDIGAACCSEILALRDRMPGHSATGREAGKGAARGATDGTGNNRGAGLMVARSQTTREGDRLDGETCTFVPILSPTLSSEGADSSEDGNNRHALIAYACQGTNVGEAGTLRGGNGHVTGGVPFILDDQGGSIINISREVAPTLRRETHGNVPAVLAFSAKDYGADASDIAPTLRAGGHTTSHANAGVMPAVAFSNRGVDSGGVTETVRAGSHGALPMASVAQAVRRLTPGECEKLQGLPPDWTRYRADGTEQADSARYRQIGNGVAVPVVHWIAQRLVQFGTPLVHDQTLAAQHEQAYSQTDPETHGQAHDHGEI